MLQSTVHTATRVYTTKDMPYRTFAICLEDRWDWKHGDLLFRDTEHTYNLRLRERCVSTHNVECRSLRESESVTLVAEAGDIW